MTDLPGAATATSDRELVINRIFDAPREIVFEAWTSKEHVARWFGPKDFTAPYCAVDFRVGGSYRVCMRSPEGQDHWVSGEYREIVEPSRIVFTWIREDADGKIWSSTVVELTFAEDGDRTVFTLRQGEFETLPYCEEHGFGWNQCLDRFGSYVENLSH